MVRVRSWLAGWVLVGGGCTGSNPAFDGAETSGADDDAADDERGTDDGVQTTSSASAESDAGSFEGSDAGESPIETDGGESESEAGSSGGVIECAGEVEYDWGIEILDDGLPLPGLDCGAPLVLTGLVIDAFDDTVVFTQCDSCECPTPLNPLELRAPAPLPLAEFPANACARFQIEWSTEEDCKPVGFAASTNRLVSMRPVMIAGQDVPAMPEAVGGEPIAMSTIEPCECPDCCEKSGIGALDFGSGGGAIPEGGEDHIEGLAGTERTWLVSVYEAHTREDCTRPLSWSAVIDEM